MTSAQPGRVPHPNAGGQGAAALPFPAPPTPPQCLCSLALPAHPPHPTPPGSGQWRSSLCSPELSRTSKARAGDRTNWCSAGVGAWARGPSKKEQRQNQTEGQAGDDPISRQALLPPRGNTQHMAGGNTRPSFLPSPAGCSGEEERGRERPSLPEALPE